MAAACVVVVRTSWDQALSAVPVALFQSDRSSERAVVAGAVDGQTLDVRFGQRVSRVRLRDIAAPSAPGPGHPGQCLGREATALLNNLLPAGREIVLTYDDDGQDRPEATATTVDGRLVSAEMVRAGLAKVVPQVDGQRNPAREALESAAVEAAAGQRGLHSPRVGCTVPGQVKAMIGQVGRIPAVSPAGPGEELYRLANLATDARVAAQQLAWAFSQDREGITWQVLTVDERAALSRQVGEARARATTVESRLRVAANLALNTEATRGSERAGFMRPEHKAARSDDGEVEPDMNRGEAGPPEQVQAGQLVRRVQNHGEP